MKVREFMELWIDDISIKVYQEPIKQIDKSGELVLRQSGSLDVLIVNLQYDDGRIIIVCKANKEQEQKTINAYRNKI